MLELTPRPPEPELIVVVLPATTGTVTWSMDWKVFDPDSASEADFTFTVRDVEEM